MKSLHVWTLTAATVVLVALTACSSSRGLGRRSAQTADQSATYQESAPSMSSQKDQQATVTTTPNMKTIIANIVFITLILYRKRLTEFTKYPTPTNFTVSCTW